MKVILNSDVENLGEEGDICSVAPGYARNYLLPKGLVMEYTPRNIEVIEERRADIEKRKEEKRKQAAGLKDRIEDEPLKISMTAGTNGKLFGSVTAATIIERLASMGIELERKQLDVPEKSIKTVGNFKVRVKLYGDEEATLVVSVEASNAREIEKKKAQEAAEPVAEDTPAPEAAGDEDVETTESAGETAPVDAAEDVSSDDELDPEVMAMRAAAEEETGDAEVDSDDSKE